jgi:hypothetical protein
VENLEDREPPQRAWRPDLSKEEILDQSGRAQDEHDDEEKEKSKGPAPDKGNAIAALARTSTSRAVGIALLLSSILLLSGVLR